MPLMFFGVPKSSPRYVTFADDLSPNRFCVFPSNAFFTLSRVGKALGAKYIGVPASGDGNV